MKCGCGQEFYRRTDGHLMCPTIASEILRDLEKQFDEVLDK